jgi:hypothetical protein
LFFSFFAFPLLSPFHSRYHHYYYKLDNTELHTGTVTIARAMMGRWKKDGNHFLTNNKLVQEPEGNEENRYPDPDSNKRKINYAKEPNEAQNNNLTEEILQVINENFIEMICIWSTKIHRRHSRYSKTTNVGNLRKHKKKKKKL